MTTDTGFTKRQNAKRAADTMIGKGTAPAADYRLKTGDDGRIHIIWHTVGMPAAPDAPAEAHVIAQGTTELGSVDALPAAAPATTEQIETEIAAASATAAEPAAQPASAANERESPRAATDPAESEEAATAPPQPRVMAAGPDQDPELGGFEDSRLIAELERRGYRTTQARQRRTQRPAQGPRRSKAVALDEAAARGVMPTKPDVTSHANHHYQKRFDRLAELAAAGEWDAVAAYQCTGVNSYAKMVRQYRDRLLAAHAAHAASDKQQVQAR